MALYVPVHDPVWLETAERLLELFRGQEGLPRGRLEEELREQFGSDPSQLVHQGLVKLLEDRCEFQVVSGHPPEQLRDLVFRTAATHRARASAMPLIAPTGHRVTSAFNRDAVLREVAQPLGLTPETVVEGLFADLRSEQRLIRFKDITAERLLQRYNVALAQAILLRSTRVTVLIRGESASRYRQLFRLVKFHRLICEVHPAQPDGYQFQLDGPLSLFSATQKYGLQLALFLPAILLCRDFELQAELSWGPQRRAKRFLLSTAEGLVSHYQDFGTYVPTELGMFVELFRKKISDWELKEETEIVNLEDGFWVPDFRLTERATGRSVLLEVLGFWRRSGAERHLQRLSRALREPFLLAVSERLRIDESELEGLPARIYRFRQMPLPEEVVCCARQLFDGQRTTTASKG
jgi:predicted nuclease of restriction endonuclease-like RecB superfamily